MISGPRARRHWTRAVPIVPAIVLTGAVLAGCTGSSNDPNPSATSSATASAVPGPADLAQAADQVTQQYLNPATPTVLASVKGLVAGGGKNVPGTAELLLVQAGPNSTLVRWRMSTDQPVAFVSTDRYRTEDFAVPDVSGVTLVAKQANLRLRTGHWSGSAGASRDCTCAWVPHGMGSAGVELSILYPALPASVTEIQLQVPGFPPLSAPVSRS